VNTEPIRRIDGQTPPARPDVQPARENAVPFDRVLADRLATARTSTEELRFSGHALDRVRQRGIDVGPERLARLHEGVERAAAKGGRDSLVLVDGTAFVVSVANRTVVTAVDPEHMRKQVFTNIDSAVIA
jgi:flagellar operon protein